MYLSKSNLFETFLGKDVPGQVIIWQKIGNSSKSILAAQSHCTNLKMVIKIFVSFLTPVRITKGWRSIKDIDKFGV